MWVFCPLLVTFAHFHFKSGQAETPAAVGFAGFLPTFPLFFSINCDKKIIILYK